MSTRSYHRTKKAARKEAKKWEKKGYLVFLEHPERKMKKGDFRIVTEGKGGKKKTGKVIDVTKIQEDDRRSGIWERIKAKHRK